MTQLSAVLKEHLPRYEIQERIGSGGMASVYRAVDRNLGREVAIKVLHEHLVHEEAFAERFEQEARLIAGFNHPNVIRVYDFDRLTVESSNIYYMVMPYLVGETLSSLLQDQNDAEKLLPTERVKQIIADVANGLDYAHSRQMIHRDVKPANIVFDETGKAILTDFGIARLLQQTGLTQAGHIVGTPAYMSPEQATGDTVDHRSDLYALGVILYELLTGTPPFRDEGTLAILIKHAQEEPELISKRLGMPNPALDRVVAKSLAKNPQERFQSGAELVNALNTALTSVSNDSRHIEVPHGAKKAIQNKTVVLDAPTSMRFTRSIDTYFIKPAKQNPLGLVAVAIALVALLIVARLSQSGNDNTAESSSTEQVADSMTSETFYFESTFEPDDPTVTMSMWDEGVSGSITRQIADGKYSISSTQASIATATLFDTSYRYEDVYISMDARLTAESTSPASGYGIIFRYQDADNYNVFAIDGVGRFSIWTRIDGRWQELRKAESDWTENIAIHLIGESNHLTLNINHNQIDGYVNDVLVISIEDTTFIEGAVGIYMATARSGEAQIEVDQFSVGETVANSMTDD